MVVCGSGSVKRLRSVSGWAGEFGLLVGTGILEELVDDADEGFAVSVMALGVHQGHGDEGAFGERRWGEGVHILAASDPCGGDEDESDVVRMALVSREGSWRARQDLNLRPPV